MDFQNERPPNVRPPPAPYGAGEAELVVKTLGGDFAAKHRDGQAEEQAPVPKPPPRYGKPERLAYEHMLEACVAQGWARTVVDAYLAAVDVQTLLGAADPFDRKYLRGMARRLAKKRIAPKPLTPDELLDALIDRAVST
jgi:hypothetical protein